MHNDGDAGSEFPSFDGADFSFSGLDDLFSNEDEDVRNDEGDTGDDYNQCSICCIFYHSSNLRSCITHSDIKICSKVCLKIHKDVAINPGDCAFLEISKDVEDVARINFRNRNKQKKKYIKLTDNEKRREIASLMSTACKCATGNCLYKPEINQQIEDLILKERDRTFGMADVELFGFIQQAVNSAGKFNKETSRILIRNNMRLGDLCNEISGFSICMDAWRRVYELSEYAIKAATKGIKSGYVTNEPSFSDNTKVKISRREISKLSKEFSLDPNLNDLSMMTIPNTAESGVAFIWIKDYLRTAGHAGSTGCSSIAVDSTEKQELFDEYLLYMMDVHRDTGIKPLNIGQFLKLLRDHFGFVTFHKAKTCALKCPICADLAIARRTIRDGCRKKLVVLLHAYHRSMYMGQRNAYYMRREYALTYSLTHWSFIEDGMQQNHNELPHQAGTIHFDPTLPHHIEGVLSHGFRLFLFRTYHNYTSTRNLVIHSFLLSLEYRIRETKIYPEVLFWQVDGARDNTSITVLALCQYLVETGIVKRTIVYSRLPKGHGHEDIDAKFALIWEAIRSIAVMSPKQYSVSLQQIFGSTCKEEELFIIPDYGSFFQDFVDKNIANYSVMMETQHQFVFQKVFDEKMIETGVKSETIYRAYADTERPFMFSREIEDGLLKRDPIVQKQFAETQEEITDTLKAKIAGNRARRSGAVWKIANSIKEQLQTADLDEEDMSQWARVFEIYPAHQISKETELGKEIGWSVVSVAHRWYPLLGEPVFRIMPNGLPTGTLFPLGFLPNGSVDLLNTWNAVKKKYKSDTDVYKDWSEFINSNQVPKTDSVVDHMNIYNIQLNIPFAREGLFVSRDPSYRPPDVILPFKQSDRSRCSRPYAKATAMPCVLYNGNKHLESDLNPRVFDDGEYFLKISPPYKNYSVKVLRQEIRNRGLVDHESRGNKKVQWYCEFLEEDDKERAQYLPYLNLPTEAFDRLLVQAGLEIVGDNKLERAKAYAVYSTKPPNTSSTNCEKLEADPRTDPETKTRKRMNDDGENITPPYNTYTIKVLRQEIKKRGLVDHDSKSNKKAEWYCEFLENHDKELNKASFITHVVVASDVDPDTGDEIAAEQDRIPKKTKKNEENDD